MKHVNFGHTAHTPPFLDGDTDVQIHIYISINQLQKPSFTLELLTRVWLIQNNAKFMDNALVFVPLDKGHKASVGNFLLCFTNQSFDIQIVPVVPLLNVILNSIYSVILAFHK